MVLLSEENNCEICSSVGLECTGTCERIRVCKTLVCDQCGEEVDELYLYDDMELCKECAIEYALDDMKRITYED